jgi:hypothetical protein
MSPKYIFGLKPYILSRPWLWKIYKYFHYNIVGFSLLFEYKGKRYIYWK